MKPRVRINVPIELRWQLSGQRQQLICREQLYFVSLRRCSPTEKAEVVVYAASVRQQGPHARVQQRGIQHVLQRCASVHRVHRQRLEGAGCMQEQALVLLLRRADGRGRYRRVKALRQHAAIGASAQHQVETVHK